MEEEENITSKEWKDPMGNTWPSFEAYQQHWDKIDKPVPSVPAPWDYALGAAAAKPLVGASIGKYGLDKTLEVGLNAVFPDVQDSLLEQGLRAKQMGLAATAVKGTRIAYDEILKILDTSSFKVPNPFKLKHLIRGTGQGMEGRTPEPAWKKTPRPDEKIVWTDRFADEVLYNATGKHIAQRTEGGYKFLGKFRSEWNKWSKNTGFIRELSDKPQSAYVEHLTGKDKYYDRFWALPNELRFRKGSRHSPNNVRILYSNRMKSFKDASETILKSLYNPKDTMNLLLFDWEIPKMKGRSITVKQSPRDLLLKRVDGTIVGRLGDYHDILYASDNAKVVGKENTLSYKLGTNINPRTNRPYINLNTTPKNIAEQITKWRETILRDKIQFIVNEAPTLKDYKTKASRWEYQGSAIEKDMVDFLTEYSFIEPPKGLRKQLKQDIINSPRGGKPIVSESEKLKRKIEGTFLNKTQERKIMDAKRKGRLNLDELFPPREE